MSEKEYWGRISIKLGGISNREEYQVGKKSNGEEYQVRKNIMRARISMWVGNYILYTPSLMLTVSGGRWMN